MEESPTRKFKEHIITSFSTEARTAICSKCGEVPLAFRPSNGGNYASCGDAVRITHGGKYTRKQYQLWKPGIELKERKQQHTILSFNKETMLGKCISCGEIPVKRWDSPSRVTRNIATVMCMYKWALYPLKIEVTPEELRQAFKSRTCNICEIPFTWNVPTYIDHNHTTNRFRGLLCVSCNFGIGNLKEDPVILSNAIEYLKR